MVTCQTTLKSGLRKGQLCGNKAKYKHMGNPLCGTHYRPYKKLSHGSRGLPIITRHTNSNRTVSHMINQVIYPNQAKASEEITTYFKNGIRAVILAAEMQSGKSGTVKDTIVRFMELFPDSVASIILTINDNDLFGQMQREFGSYVSYNYIFKATDLCSKTYLKTLLVNNQGKKILLIIDESHYGNSKGGSLDSFFSSSDIGLDGCNLPKDIHLLTISATSNAEVALLGHPAIHYRKKIVVLQNDIGYYGIANMLEDGSLKEGWKLEGDTNHTSWESLKSTITQFCTGGPKYKIIRVNDSNGIKILRETVSDLNIKFISYDQHSVVRDINEIVGLEPAEHTVIALAQKLKASKQLDTRHVNMMFEYSNGNISTTVQGLPGRRSGYGKTEHNVTIFSNIKHCEMYNTWAKGGFKPSGTPNDHHVTHGVQGRESELWEKNVPVEVDLGNQVLQDSCRAILKQVIPLIKAQYPNIIQAYPKPLSGSGILIIKSTSKLSTKEDWWSRPISAMTTARKILGYPRTIKEVKSENGFFLFVNLVENRVLLTYTRKNKEPKAEPVVASTCVYKPMIQPKILVSVRPVQKA